MQGALSDQTTAGDLLLFQPERMESEKFFEFVHAEPCLSQWFPLALSGSPSPAELAELLLMNRCLPADWHSEPVRFLIRHQFGTIIDMTSESLSTSVRNAYRHRQEFASFVCKSLLKNNLYKT
jgi:hypothetical protein